MKMKKVLAVVMSLCMTIGVISYGAPVITQGIIAQADSAEGSCYSFDASTGVLTLKGNVDGDELRGLSFSIRKQVKSIVAEKGTVLPENSSRLFYDCYYCSSIDLSRANTSKVTNMSNMFYCCYHLTELDISGFDTSNVTDMSGMFESCSDLTTLDVSNFNTSNVTNMRAMFAYCPIQKIDVSGFDTSKVTDMSSMFTHCTITTIDLSGFDTRKVTDMSSMFNSDRQLRSVNLSGFDTSNVTKMCGMFDSCNNLTKIDVSGFDTSNVVDINYMFYECRSLTTIDVRGFDTSNVKSMGGVFAGCSGLTNIDVSGFDTSNTTFMYQLFKDCSKLKTLDLSNFDTRKVNYMDEMFDNCTELKTITLGENFKNITADAKLPNGEGWVNAKATSTIISGDGEYAVISNSGKNTYKRLPIKAENPKNALTYPTNIKVEYSKEYHQVRFTWDKVKDADRYAIAIYVAGKWKVQTQNITDTVYISPKNLTPGMTYKVAIAARVNGIWDTKNAIRHPVIVNIPFDFRDRDGDGIRDNKDSQPDQENNYPRVLVDYINNDIIDMDYTEETDDDFVICKTPLSEILLSFDVNTLTDDGGVNHAVDGNYDDWYIMALNRNGKETYGLYKMREQECDPDDDDHDNNDPGVAISFVEFDISKLNDVIYHNTSDTSDLYNEIDKVVRVPNALYSSELQSYFVDVNSDAPYLIAEAYVDKIANSNQFLLIPFPTQLIDIYDEIDTIDGMINSMLDAQTIAALYQRRAQLIRVPDALTECNNNFGSIIADENTKMISITSPNNLDYNEKRAILSAYTADTSFNMFAAEVQAHADYLDDIIAYADLALSYVDSFYFGIDWYGGSIYYARALRADMAIGEEYESGMFDSYYDPNDSRVVAQANAHGAY